ncbi:MAG: putative thiol oxidoreductase with 2 cytochrome c heme-binding site [Ilumatobacteraceae bacterium]|nr:putative thiol oxidoreductase with 2 cytochrome c heme-binding site [Ilumatobacteraceae bacterium]
MNRPTGHRVARGILALAVLGGLLAGCTSDSRSDGTTATTSSAPTDQELQDQGGADGTTVNQGATAFAQGMEALDSQGRRDFAVGNSFFNQNWVMAPSSTVARDGLGPIFNAQSCSSCHFEDGRGQPPTEPDDPTRGLLIRLSVLDEDGNPQPHPDYGNQFQDRAIRKVPAEGSVEIDVTEEPGRYPDGTEYSLGAPTYRLVTPEGKAIDDIVVSPRVAPAMMGVGLLENVPAETIEALADPDDTDGDGVSGRPHLVEGEDGEEVLGRFGWKAAVPTVRKQTTEAFANDIGITSDEHPDQPCMPAQTGCVDARSGGDPEIDADKVDKIEFYSRTLAVPARRDVGEPDTAAGQQAFEEIGCVSCHTSELTTGSDSAIPALNDQVIRPYSDLLLHDMGERLADDRPDGDASGTEWRTPPLWGIGLVETVNGHTRFLHDGRARSIEEAILWHGGEAEGARDRFEDLPAKDRKSVITFLESL